MVWGIVRCGVGTNNISVKEMSEFGILVFNILGVNVNVVKEFVVCFLFLVSCGIIEGNKYVNDVINVEENGDYVKISVRIEKDKVMFGGIEIEGKMFGVIGLGVIGFWYVLFCLCVCWLNLLVKFCRSTSDEFFFLKEWWFLIRCLMVFNWWLLLMDVVEIIKLRYIYFLFDFWVVFEFLWLCGWFLFGFWLIAFFVFRFVVVS